ncbi:tyrP-A, partial [Symbiodinium necroappetens]
TPYYLGEMLEDALTAELLALCWAMCWAAQHAPAYSVPVRFLYDAQSAGQGTFGTARPVQGAAPEHYTPLAAFAAALRQYLNARLPTAHQHVKGHAGFAGNELCDALAFRLQLYVIHAPSLASVTAEEARAFWNLRATDILDRPEVADYIVMCDANSKLGDVCSDLVGDHGAEQEGQAGALFHEFLQKIDAIVPATWSQWHSGPHHTWCSPHGTWSRIDYILVPRHWQHAHFVSRTCPRVELMQLREDHIPVLLACEFVRNLPGKSYTCTRKQIFRPTPDARGKTASRFLTEAVPVTTWLASADAHYHTLVQAWQRVGSSISPPDSRTTTRPYLSQHSLDIVDERRPIRVALRDAHGERIRKWQLIVLVAFLLHARGQAFSQAQTQIADRWLKEADAWEASMLANYKRLARMLRRSVAADRIAYLDRLAQEVAGGHLGDPKSLYRVLRQAFPAARSARRQGIQPLPMLQLSDGTFARNTAERAEAWRSHFAAQEAGHKVDDSGYVKAFERHCIVEHSLDIQVVPTLSALERHILASRNARAAGPDGITAELLKLDVPLVARQLIPVLLKASLRAQEPVTFRGGELVCLAKRAGQVLGCDAYRSILVSSVPGKLYHRSLREALLPLLTSSQPTFQAGVAPGQGIEHTALAIRSFYAMSKASRKPASLTFFDLQAAFYQVLRQALVPATEGDQELLRLLHHLCLPAEAIQELCTQLRPGDPTADLMFGFTLSALMHAIQTSLNARDLVPDLPSAPDRPGCLADVGAVRLGLPAWADDFVAPQTGSDPTELLSRTRRTIETVVDFATAAGMTVKYGREKTAVLFPPAVIGNQQSAFTYDDMGQLVLGLRNSVADKPYWVPVVESYRHLGGIIVSTCDPLPDLHYRFAQASGTLKPLRRRLFGTRIIPIQLRSYFLRSLVVSKFAHSAATLFLRAAYQLRVWEQHYMTLWRALFHRRSAAEQ